MSDVAALQFRPAMRAGAAWVFVFVLLSGLLLAGEPAETGPGAVAPEKQEPKYLRQIRQLTFDGAKNGESYFSHDGQRIVFQGVREPGNPFYQIYTLELATGKLIRLSNGTGKTTCAWFHPTKNRLLYASTHLDTESARKQAEEIEKEKQGPARRYSWDFDDTFDIFECDPNGGNMVRLTESKGYDAEGSWSPDGAKIVFCSFRDGDGEIYTMDADGKNAKRLTEVKGYDGGPFFSPDGSKIIWRHIEDGPQKGAEVWIMDADGGNKKQLTKLGGVSWAPFFHPKLDWVVFAGNHQDPSFDLYLMKTDGSNLTRLTDTDGFDGLPVFSPDGTQLLWTSNRIGNKSQLFVADFRPPGQAEWTARVPFEQTPADARMAPENVNTALRALERGTEVNQVEHAIGKLMIDNRLLPLVPNAEKMAVEDTWYVQGPSVCGWSPSLGGATHALVVGTALTNDEKSREGLASMLEAARALRSETEIADGLPRPALFCAAAHPDEMPNLAENASRMLGLMTPEKPGTLKPFAYVNLSGLGGIRSRQITISGTGSSPGWKRFVERLAVRHPGVQLRLKDDPAAAPELAPFIAKGIPAIAFSATTLAEGEVDVLSGGEQNDDMVAGMIGRVEAGVLAINCAVDALRLLSRGGFELQFQKFDAMAARAAATAKQRPYLGTVPDYAFTGGVKLSGVRDGSPAQLAGMRAGDIMLELAGKPVPNLDEYMKVLETLAPGEATNVKVKRDAETLDLKITPGKR